MAAKCDRQCPASNSGCCCHVMAVIWKLEEMTRMSELKTLTPDSLPCTSKPRQWGKGHRREVEFHPVMASNVVQPRHDLPGRKRRGIQSQFYDPRPPKCQKLDVDGMVKLKHDLQSINPTIPFAAMLPDEKSIPTIQTIVGTVAKGSIIHRQLQEFSTPSTVASCANSISSVVQVNLSPSCCSSHSTPSTKSKNRHSQILIVKHLIPSSLTSKRTLMFQVLLIYKHPLMLSQLVSHMYRQVQFPKKSYIQLL